MGVSKARIFQCNCANPGCRRYIRISAEDARTMAGGRACVASADCRQPDRLPVATGEGTLYIRDGRHGLQSGATVKYVIYALR